MYGNGLMVDLGILIKRAWHRDPGHRQASDPDLVGGFSSDWMYLLSRILSMWMLLSTLKNMDAETLIQAL